MVGLIGPDGVGKSSLLALAAGSRAVQAGTVEVLDGDMASKAHRDAVCPRIAYMPQGLGKNLYPTLSVEENLQFFGRLFGHGEAERRRRIDSLTQSTGLASFLSLSLIHISRRALDGRGPDPGTDRPVPEGPDQVERTLGRHAGRPLRHGLSLIHI